MADLVRQHDSGHAGKVSSLLFGVGTQTWFRCMDDTLTDRLCLCRNSCLALPFSIMDSVRFRLSYYMGNFSDSGDWWDHRNHQQAGVAWSRKPEGPFHRLKKPVIRQKDAVMISNPSVCRLPDGRFLMIYKWVAQENPAPFYGPVCHGAAFADNPLGPFIPVRRKLFTVDGCDFPGEDPFVFTVNGRLFCILKDNGRNYSGLLKALLLFESQDGLTWEKAGIALSRNIPCENGHKKRFFRLERPQLAFCKDQIRLFCAVKPSEKNDEAFSINIPITFSIRIAQEAENRKFTL